MSDELEGNAETAASADVSEEIIEGRGEPKTPEEVAFLNALHQRKVILESLENGTLPCLSGKDGYADTAPAVNIANDTRYHGVSLLYLKDFQKRNGFPTPEYVTRNQIDKARAETGDQIFIRKDEKPVTVSFQVRNEGSGEWEQKNALLYNAAQTTKPWALKDWAAKHVQEQQQERTEFLKQQYGNNYKPYEPGQKGPGPEIACTSTEPEKYLGQYLAAVSMGGKFKVSPEQAKEFSGKLQESVYKQSFDERLGKEHTDPYKLSKICQAAGAECKDIIREARDEQRRNPQPVREQKQEQKLARGRSR
ncbi:MAG: ssDNA-binding domain-containing protein [Spirochaetaceae bacterium]|nr:ssDNA-binding domain-containing protein [Spirochaetaceae bacterium]